MKNNPSSNAKPSAPSEAEAPPSEATASLTPPPPGQAREAELLARIAQLEQTVQTLKSEITSQEQATGALREERAMLRALVENIPSDVFAKDLHSRFIFLKKAGKKTTEDEVLGKTDFDYLPRDWAEYFFAEEQEIMGTGQPMINREVAVTSLETGLWTCYLSTKVPYRDSGGKISGLVGINHFITELKQAGEALRKSEERHRILYENSPIPLWEEDLSAIKRYVEKLRAAGVTDIGGHLLAHPEEVRECATQVRVLSVNKTAITFFQVPDKQDLCRNMRGFFTQETYDGFREIILSIAQGKLSFECETSFQTHTGEKKCVVLRLSVAPGHEETLDNVLASLVDITARKLAENALSQERNLLRTLIENLPNDVFVKDTQCRFLVLNGEAVQMINAQSQEAAIGKTDFDFFPPEEAEKYFAAEQEIMRSGVPMINQEALCTDPRGRARWYLNTKIPLRDSQGRTIGLVGIKHIITDRKLAENALAEERNLLRTLVESIPSDIYVKDTQGRFMLLNTGVARCLGRRSWEEVLGKTDFDFMPQDEAEGYAAQEREIIRTGQPIIDGEVSGINPQTGEKNWRLWSKIPIRDDQGKVVGIVGLTHDITAQKKFQIELAEERNLLRTLINHIPNHIFVKDTASRFLLCNNIVAKRFGQESAESLTGKTDFDFYPADQAQRFYEQEQEIMRTGQPMLDQEFVFDSEQVAGEPSSGKRWYLSTKLPLRDHEGQTIGLVGINHNITQHKKAEAAMLRASRMEATATLAGGIAHDFNNLMVGVLGYAELLDDELPPGTNPEARRMLEEISQSAQRAGELAQQMLAYARGGKYQTRPMNLNDTIKETLQLQRRSFPPRISIRLDTEPNLWSIEADPVQMSQVMMNLCLNAVEAIADNGLITISTANCDVYEDSAPPDRELSPGRYVCLTVLDTGCGMRPETLACVFEPFFTTKFQGRGLGLAAVHGIIKNHDGHIAVQSESGGGTAFKIFLPATVTEVYKAPAPPSQISTGSETVLIIDDEDVVLDIACNILHRLGYKTLVARNGQEAVELARAYEGPIHLSLLDMGMPVMGGSETYCLLKEVHPEIKVLICSGYELDAAARALLEAGASAFIQKPFRVNTLATALRKALGK